MYPEHDLLWSLETRRRGHKIKMGVKKVDVAIRVCKKGKISLETTTQVRPTVYHVYYNVPGATRKRQTLGLSDQDKWRKRFITPARKRHQLRWAPFSFLISHL